MTCFNISFLKNAMIFLAIISLGIVSAFIADYIDSVGGWDTIAPTWFK